MFFLFQTLKVKMKAENVEATVPQLSSVQVWINCRADLKISKLWLRKDL